MYVLRQIQCRVGTADRQLLHPLPAQLMGRRDVPGHARCEASETNCAQLSM